MNEVLIYLLKSLLTGALLFGFYQAAMRRESFFRLNRFYLITTGLLIVILPFATRLIPLDLLSGQGTNSLALFTLPEIVVRSAGIISPVRQQIYLSWGALGYIIVTMAMLAGLVLSLSRVVRFCVAAKRAEKIGDNLYLYPGQLSPFSFMGRIYISHKYLDHPGLKNILIHENAHIRQYHILDLFLLELLSSLFWFNPFFFLIKKALREVHEFLADREVINSGAQPLHYQQLLYNVVSGNPQYIIANNFNLFTKKRIIMLNKKSDKMAAVRIGIALPLILVAAFFVAMLQDNSLMAQNTRQSKKLKADSAGILSPAPPAVNAPETDQMVPPPPPPPPPPPGLKQKTEGNAVQGPEMQEEKKVYKKVDVMPQFPGGQEGLIKYLVGSIKYPPEARKKGLQGMVYMSFIVDESGRVSNVNVTKGIGGGLDQEAMRVVKAMPEWIPGKDKGKPVAVQYTLPIKFALEK